MPDAPLAVVVVLAIGQMATAWVALHYRSEAIRHRCRSAYWRARTNDSRRAIRSAWCRKCGPPIDRATAGRIAAYLTGGDVPCR